MIAHVSVRPPLELDPELTVPIDLLEQLPLSLTRDPKREAKARSVDGRELKIYGGHRDGSDFVIQARWDTLVVKRRRAGERAKTYEVTVGYAPVSSPWTLVETLCQRLKSYEHSPIYIGGMVTEMRLLRETTVLVPQVQRFADALTPVQELALAFVAERAGLDGLELLLTFPFQILADADFVKPLWTGHLLPNPLNDLRPTMVVFKDRNDFCFQPVEVRAKAMSSSPIEAMKQLRTLAEHEEGCLEALEHFADHIRTCYAVVCDPA